MTSHWKPDLDLLAQPARAGHNQRTVRDGFWRKVRASAAKIPFATDAVAGYYAAMDPATPARVKMLLFAALAYFVVPTDAVPDFIAALGFTDDAAVFLAAWRMVRDHVRPDHHDRARAALANLSED